MRLQKCKNYENLQKRVFQKTSFYADNLKCLHYPTWILAWDLGAFPALGAKKEMRMVE